MGGGSSSPKLMDEIRINANEINKETFENKYIDYKPFLFIVLLFLLFLLFSLFILFLKKRYKD